MSSSTPAASASLAADLTVARLLRAGLTGRWSASAVTWPWLAYPQTSTAGALASSIPTAPAAAGARWPSAPAVSPPRVPGHDAGSATVSAATTSSILYQPPRRRPISPPSPSSLEAGGWPRSTPPPQCCRAAGTRSITSRVTTSPASSSRFTARRWSRGPRGRRLQLAGQDVMDSQFWWYVTRASGIVAWLLLTASVIWGVILSTHAFPERRRPAWLLDLHRWLGGLTVSFVAIHLLALVADSYTHFDLADLAIPFASIGRAPSRSVSSPPGCSSPSNSRRWRYAGFPDTSGVGSTSAAARSSG